MKSRIIRIGRALQARARHLAFAVLGATLLGAIVVAWLAHPEAAADIVAGTSAVAAALAAFAAMQAARATRDSVKLQSDERHWHVLPVLAVPGAEHPRIEDGVAVVRVKNFGSGPAMGVQARLRVRLSAPPIVTATSETAVYMHLVFVRYSPDDVAPIIPQGEGFDIKIRLPRFLHEEISLPSGWEIELLSVDAFRRSVYTTLREILGVVHAIPHNHMQPDGWGRVNPDDPWTVLYIQQNRPHVGASAREFARDKGWDLNL